MSWRKNAPVSEWGDDQTAGVAEVLIPVQELSVHCTDVQVLPGPIISIGRREGVDVSVLEYFLTFIQG